ncbi:MAG: toprim domain-containing protein [Burkholderiaceae bacterium]
MNGSIGLAHGKALVNGRHDPASDDPRLNGSLNGVTSGASVVRLWPDEAVELGLGIGKGIETCLMAAHGFQPVWSCLNSGNLATCPVLAGIECLTVFADHDVKGAGQAAAWECRNRWIDAGVRARVILPDAVGDDVADEWTRCAE